MSATPTTTHTQHERVLCHDHRHDNVAGECPTCGGWLATCIDPRCEHLADHVRAKMRKITGDLPQTPSAIVATAEDTGAPGREVETPPPSPSRPDAHTRVTYAGPFVVEQQVGDDDWTVLVALTDAATEQLARDVAINHISDLLILRRALIQSRDLRRHHNTKAAAEWDDIAWQAQTRLTYAMNALASTHWTLTPSQAEQLAADLEDAQADPGECAVGTCTGLAVAGGSYCAPHEDGI